MTQFCHDSMTVVVIVTSLMVNVKLMLFYCCFFCLTLSIFTRAPLTITLIAFGYIKKHQSIMFLCYIYNMLEPSNLNSDR